MEPVQIPPKLLSRISSAKQQIDGCPHIRVVSHYDADGISAAGVLCNMLVRENKRFHATLLKSLDAHKVKELGKGCDCLIFSDMGSSYLKELEGLECPVIVLDHHSLTGDSEKVIHINPHVVGIDGMVSASASAMCMLLAAEVNEANWSLLPIAFAGIVGDRQHIKGLSGINAYLYQEGVSRKIVEVKAGAILPEGPLASSLLLSIEPYVLGVSGNEAGVAELLSKAGIKNDSTAESLSENERRKLSSILALKLLEQGTPLNTLEEMVHEVFFFPKEGMTAGEIASLLNACGRLDRESTGLALTLGDDDALAEARKLRREYLLDVISAVNRLARSGLQQMDNIQYFYNDTPSLAGVICGTSMQYFANRDKPTISLSKKGEDIKISSRATYELIGKGINLATALRESASSVGGIGGGHAIASGATIPAARVDGFLKRLDEIVGKQKTQ